MAYLLPMIFLIVSLCRFAVGKVYVESLSKKAVIVLAVVTILTFFSLTINPSGFDMIIYPYANMGDELMQASISEWAAPDAKKIGQLVMFFAPMAMMSLGIVCTEKKSD